MITAAAAATTEAPVRSEVLRSLGGAGDRSGLETFLAMGSDQAAVEAWFGAESAASLGQGRLRRMLDRDIAEIDALLSRSVNAVLHHARFRSLESAWRGLHWLTQSLGPDGMTVLRVLDCRWAELVRDLERAPEFDQTALFDKVYNEEFGTPGGVPFSTILGLYEVRHRPSREHPTDDVTALRQLSAVAAAAFCPILLGASPALLGVDHFGELDLRQSIAQSLRQPEYARFQSLQQWPDARFLGVVAPRILLRLPYRGRRAGDCGFRFEEEPGQLWGAGALAIGQICLRTFNEHRWLAGIRGTVQDQLAGGVVTTLPVEDFETDAAGARFSVEVNVSETVERDMAEAGIIVLRRCKDTPYVAVYNLPTLHRAKGAYSTEIARVNEQMGAMLNYILCVARFAHYILIIARNWVGSYKSAEDCEQRLQSWLNTFCADSVTLSYEMRARYPLQEGRVQVRDIPGQPGSYECVAAFKPHFELDQAVSEFQLVTTIQGVERKL